MNVSPSGVDGDGAEEMEVTKTSKSECVLYLSKSIAGDSECLSAH